MEKIENAEDTEASKIIQRRPTLLEPEVGEDAEASETTQRRPTLLLNSEVGEDAKAETVKKIETTQRQSTLLLNSEVGEGGEASQTTQSMPTMLKPEVGEDAEASKTTQRWGTLLNLKVGDGAEASQTTKRRPTQLKPEVAQRWGKLLNLEVGESEGAEAENVGNCETTQRQSTLLLKPEVGEDAEASETTQRRPTLLNLEVGEGEEAETIGNSETTQRQSTLLLNSGVGEGSEASKSTKRRPTLLKLVVVEDAEASKTTQRWPTLLNQEVGEGSETTKCKRTLLKPEFGEDVETSETTKRRRMLLKPEVREDAEASETSQRRPTLLLKPEVGDTYDTLPLAFPAPSIYRALENFLPLDVRANSEKDKAKYMDEILLRYASTQEEKELREYRNKIKSKYTRLHEELYVMQPRILLVPSFMTAICVNTEEGFRKIMSEPSTGIFTFDMLQPKFCEMLLAEVNHFQKWIHQTDFQNKHRNTMNNRTNLDDLGMEPMLEQLMERFIIPISRVFFTHVGGHTLDHYDCAVQCHTNSDIDLAVQVDDAEVTLNVCLGQRFLGGELCFHGVRCEKHVDTLTQPGEVIEHSRVGRAILHCGRNIHNTRATTDGRKFNLILWCRSTGFRSLSKHQTRFSWCPECKPEKGRHLVLNCLFL